MCLHFSVKPTSHMATNNCSWVHKCNLQDVLAICGADLPPWCATLVFDYKFMLPFALRSRYFHCTAFGLARALQHLQQQQAAEGAAAQPLDREARELRVGRIQRQKVLVSADPCATCRYLKPRLAFLPLVNCFNPLLDGSVAW